MQPTLLESILQNRKSLNHSRFRDSVVDIGTMSTLDLRCLMAQPNSGIGNVTTNTGLVEMAMAYSRSRVLFAAARLGVADALGDEVRNVNHVAETCQADVDGLYRLLRALASI